MTSKDFQLIANVLRGSPYVGTVNDPSEKTRAQLAHGFAGALAHSNPRFNRALFLRACGVSA